jgi:hypothetical protein
MHIGHSIAHLGAQLDVLGEHGFCCKIPIQLKQLLVERLFQILPSVIVKSALATVLKPAHASHPTLRLSRLKGECHEKPQEPVHTHHRNQVTGR